MSNIEKGVGITSAVAAKTFVDTLLKHQMGMPRTPEAKLQNQILRDIISRSIVHPRTFFQNWKIAAGEDPSLKGDPEVTVYDRYLKRNIKMHVSLLINRVESGILNMLAVVNERKLLAKSLPAGTEVYLGTNDELDALSQIDLVEIHYKKSTVPTIDKVLLIQAKSPFVNGSATMIPDAVAAHQLFVDRLGVYSDEMARRLKESKEFLLAHTTPELPAPGHANFVYDLFEPTTTVQSVQKYLSGLSPYDQAVLLAFLSVPDHINAFAELLSLSSVEIAGALNLANATVASYPIDIQAWRSFNPAWVNERVFMETTNFESLFMSGVIVDNQTPLSVSNTKTLTKVA